MPSNLVRFYRHVFLFLLLNVGILLLILAAIHIAFVQKHWQTDADVYIIPQHQDYRFILLGTSHARNFARFDNQRVVEGILGEHFFNLAQANAGPVIEHIFLQYFFDNKNTTKTAVYFIDPQVFYTSRDNEAYDVLPLYGEVNLHMLTLLFQHHISYQTILSYVKTYLSLKWFIKNPRPNLPETALYVPNQELDSQRISQLYPDGLQPELQKSYVNDLDQIISLCKQHNVKLIFVLPPTLIQQYPGMDRLRSTLDAYRDREGIVYYDYSHSVTDTKLYSNIDHLNSAGVAYFSKRFLRLIPELKN